MDKMIYLKNNVTKITKDDFGTIQNGGAALGLKPKGGLWFSEYFPRRKYISEWQKWCFEQNFNKLDVLTNGVVFSIKKDARCFIIDSEEDFFNLKERYELGPSLVSCRFNWIKIAKDYDVVYVTKNGIMQNYYNMYGWDLESGVVLNFDVIEKQRAININSKKWVSNEELESILNPNMKKTYIYNINVPFKGLRTGFIKATSFENAHSKLWGMFKNEFLRNRSEYIDAYLKFDSSIYIYYVCKDNFVDTFTSKYA